jgi:hypothetical protein
MTQVAASFANKLVLSNPDPEVELVRRLVDSVAEGGSNAGRMAIINFYVALKTKPMIILTGDAQIKKTVLVRALSQVLIGDDRMQRQILAGHPWWAGVRGASGTLTSIHTRFVTEKILAAIDEASQPENLGKMYLVCLSEISPAELSSCFVEVAYQLKHGEIMRIGDVHFSRPLRFPENMWLLGTMDTTEMIPLDEHLISEAMIVQGQSVEMKSHPLQHKNSWQKNQITFLRSRIRGRQAAYQKLQSILSERGATLSPFLKVVQRLNNAGRPLPSSVMDHCITYLANAFSIQGEGLFDQIPYRNLEIASDMVIEQILLLSSREKIRASRRIRQELHDLLRTFPRSQAFLGAL